MQQCSKDGDRQILLPLFWAEKAAGWYAHVETRFWSQDILEEWDRFYYTVAALGKEIIHLCFAAGTQLDEEAPFTRFKEDLLQQHTLTKYQRIERLHAFSQGPTQLLPELMSCSCLFAFLFMQSLPAPGFASCWKRTTMTSSGSWGVKADRLLAGHKQTGTVAVVH
jgi:hypothetical protein